MLDLVAIPSILPEWLDAMEPTLDETTGTVAVLSVIALAALHARWARKRRFRRFRDHTLHQISMAEPLLQSNRIVRIDASFVNPRRGIPRVVVRLGTEAGDVVSFSTWDRGVDGTIVDGIAAVLADRRMRGIHGPSADRRTPPAPRIDVPDECWSILGVPPWCDERAVALAWRTTAKRLHPDIVGSDRMNPEFLRLKAARDRALTLIREADERGSV